MRILTVLTYYTPHISGLTIYVRRLCEELARRGHEVTVMASRHRTDLPRKELIEGVSVVRLPVLFKVNKGVIPPTMPWEAYRLIRQHDVVHMHAPLLGAGYVAWAASLRPRKRTVMTYHCDVDPPHSPVSILATRALAFSHVLAARQVDFVVVNSWDYAEHSPFLSRFLPKVVPIYPPIFVAPPDPLRASRWRSELGLDGTRIVGFAGRFSADKGGDFLLRTIPKVVAAVPNARYVFAGEHRDVIGENFFERTRPLVEQSRGNVLFLGQVSDLQLGDFFSLCDVLALPSVNSTESFGMVQAEAMLCGTPVVATDIPGVREAVRLTGMGKLVQPRDEDALADAIVEVLLHRDDYLKPRINLIEAFSVTRAVDRFEELYTGASAGS